MHSITLNDILAPAVISFLVLPSITVYPSITQILQSNNFIMMLKIVYNFLVEVFMIKFNVFAGISIFFLAITTSDFTILLEIGSYLITCKQLS